MEQIPKGAKAIGYQWLVEQFKLAHKVIPHFRASYLIEQGGRRVLKDQAPMIYLYDQGYALDNPSDPLQNMVFALKHEGMNLGIFNTVFAEISPEDLQSFIAEQPTGKYQRILWYLYEKLTNKTLALPDLKPGSYINLLDPEDYYTSTPIAQRRYRINDNLLGDMRFCCFVRKTEFLKTIEDKHLDQVARDIMQGYDQLVLDRASTYLYAQETMSSYQIERERPSKQRLARFIELVKKVEDVPVLTQAILIALQNNLVDERFINTDYRTSQNYIGQTHGWHHQIIHYISPKPDDVPEFMRELFATLDRMIASGVHPIVIAATISFAFVFIHPFDDGNGRLHRFLIHYILHRTSFTPRGMIFPVSAIILADMQHYTMVLEKFSKPLMAVISNYDLSDESVLTVHQETSSLYRYNDYTAQAEYLAACIETTIHTDFKKELIYLTNYDKAKKELAHIVDMPDQLFDLFITLVMQNNGKLSQLKRTTHFAMLTDDEISRMELVVQNCMLKTWVLPGSPVKPGMT